MPGNYVVALITAPNDEVGRQIAAMLVEKKLAACVNMIASIRSFYRWEGKMNEDEEVLLMVKTRAELFEDHLVPEVQAVHPYSVPEIIALPILLGSKSYLDWIGDETK